MTRDEQTAWHKEARALFLAGETLTEIGKRFGVHRTTVRRATIDLEPPVTRKRFIPIRRAAWHAKAREMRANGASLKEIAKLFDKSIDAVSLACKGIACPVSHNSVAQKIAQSKRWEGYVKKPRIRTKRSYVPKVKSAQELAREKRMAVLRSALTLDRNARGKQPVSLPKLSFLEWNPT